MKSVQNIIQVQIHVEHQCGCARVRLGERQANVEAPQIYARAQREA